MPAPIAPCASPDPERRPSTEGHGARPALATAPRPQLVRVLAPAAPFFRAVAKLDLPQEPRR